MAVFLEHKRIVNIFFRTQLLALIGAGTLFAQSLHGQSSASNRKIFMTLGETKSIEIPWEHNLNVSRRGVIFLKHLGAKKWQVTALKSGVVMILGDSSTSTNPVLIEVMPRQMKKKIKPSESEQKPNTSSGIQLDVKLERILVIVRGYITLDEDAVSTRSGFSTNASLKLAAGGATPNKMLTATYNPQADSSLMNTIASPVISVLTGTQATAHTGGEFPVQISSDQAPGTIKEGWKEYGFRLTVTPERASEGLIELTYEMTLKTVTSSGNTPKLSSNELSGTILLTKGVMIQAGKVDLSGNGKDSSGPADGVPILGPLFSESKKDRANKKLTLWLEYDVQQLMPESEPTPPKSQH